MSELTDCRKLFKVEGMVSLPAMREADRLIAECR